jgi:hypothetical protein
MLLNHAYKCYCQNSSITNNVNLLILFSGPLFRSGIMLDPHQKENILLLGMVFSDQLVPKRGQEFRDRARSIQLQQRLGYII